MRGTKTTYYILLILFLALPFTGKSQLKNTTFKAGERVSYNAWYHWGFIWMNAGAVDFTVRDSSYKNQDAYYIQALGRTHKKYDSFFKVRDTFHVFTSKDTLSTYSYYRSQHEGSTKLQVYYHTDLDSMKMYAKRRKPGKKFKKDTFDIFNNSYDVLTAIYAIRNIDFSKYKVGEKIPFRLWLDMKYYDVYVRYRGIEDIKLKDGRMFNCLVFTPLLVEGTLFKDGEGMKVYVTNDRNRVPVYIEAKIIIGKVKAILTDTENLRYPLESEITNK